MLFHTKPLWHRMGGQSGFKVAASVVGICVRVNIKGAVGAKIPARSRELPPPLQDSTAPEFAMRRRKNKAQPRLWLD